MRWMVRACTTGPAIGGPGMPPGLPIMLTGRPGAPLCTGQGEACPVSSDILQAPEGNPCKALPRLLLPCTTLPTAVLPKGSARTGPGHPDCTAGAPLLLPRGALRGSVSGPLAVRLAGKLDAWLGS